MRYIIYYRQNVDNTLAWKETPGIPVTRYIIGDRSKRELVFTAKTLIILKRAKRTLIKGWIFDSTKNTNLTPLEK